MWRRTNSLNNSTPSPTSKEVLPALHKKIYFAEMRKGIALLLLLLILSFVVLSIRLPATSSVKETAQFRVSAKAFSRALFDESSWTRWWPQKTNAEPASPTQLSYKGNQFRLVEKKLSSLLISVQHNDDSVLTELILTPATQDSVELNWIATINAAANPLDRLQKKQWSKELSADLQTLLQAMRSYYTNPDHLYSLHIEETTVVDSTLIFTTATGKAYPTTETIYRLIDKLKAFAQGKGARQTGLPMLNITNNDDGSFTTKVALPVDKKLPNEGDIQYRWMLGGGNILVTEVKGGPERIEKAFAVMEQYVDENNRVAPAIPFQSLVTDRREEPDTNKWVTKLYWPVM